MRVGILIVGPVCILIAPCGLARNQELQSQSQAAARQCDAAYSADDTKVAVARAKCHTAAWQILRPTLPYPDILDLLIAKRLAIAEQVQKGQMSLTEANVAIATARADAAAEEQRRQLANRSVAAQEGMVAAQEGMVAAATAGMVAAATAPRY